MNRDELAEVLASTHGRFSAHQPQGDRQHSANTRPSVPVPSPTQLSPRQVFQSRIRTLSDDGSVSPRRSSDRNRGELERRSTLRVHVRSPRSTRSTALPSNNHVYHMRNGMFAYSSTEPDFVAEERAAWTGTPIDGRGSSKNEEANIWTDADQVTLRRSLPSESFSQPPESITVLHTFGPSSSSVDLDERPKTSRGNATQADSDTNTTAARKSKFFEGSMNDRSVGISSTWNGVGERLSDVPSSEADESESTPRAARISTDSFSSTDLSEFRPAAATPATLKQRLSRLASNFRSGEDVVKATDKEPAQPKRKGLRKSISIWGFHNLGEKVKFFGTSAFDVSSAHGHNPKHEKAEQLDVLTERKRKAEEAYAEQFGTKKQKTKYGVATEDRNRTIRQPSRTLKKRSVSAQLTPTIRRRRDVSASTIVPSLDPADLSGSDDTDLRKRPSRQQLEKENHQLRAMLREQRAQSRGNLQLAASQSSLHLPLDGHGEPGKPVPTAPKQQAQAGIPPVPPLPSRAVLATLGNRNSAGSDALPRMRVASGQQETGTITRVTRSAKHAYSLENAGENANPAHSKSASKEEWQWPDDVF